MWLLCRQMNKHLKARKITILLFSLLLVSCGESEIVPTTSGTTSSSTSDVTPPSEPTTTQQSTSSTASTTSSSEPHVCLHDGEKHYSCDEVENYEDYKVEVVCDLCNEVLQTLSLNTGLPIISINTNNEPIASKETYVSGGMKIINTDSSVNEYEMEIKGRGNATWNYPKKPYKLKLSAKKSLLGMNKNKSWALLANYSDKTLLRNAIAFKTSELLGMEYTIDYRFVDLIINGEYVGNYMLTETVKEGIDRVNVSDDGFILEYSQYDDEELKFTTDCGHSFNFKFPDDEISDEQMNYTKNLMNEFESVLYADDETAFDPTTGYRNYIDIHEWAKWFLAQNIIVNQDTNRYIYKYDNTDGSKLKYGPMWDAEWSLGVGWYNGERPNPNHSLVNHLYYSRLINDPYFKSIVKEEWDAIKGSIETNLMNFIDQEAVSLSVSQEVNFTRWDIMNSVISVGGIPMGSYWKELKCDKDYLSAQLQYLTDLIATW